MLSSQDAVKLLKSGWETVPAAKVPVGNLVRLMDGSLLRCTYNSGTRILCADMKTDRSCAIEESIVLTKCIAPVADFIDILEVLAARFRVLDDVLDMLYYRYDRVEVRGNMLFCTRDDKVTKREMKDMITGSSLQRIEKLPCRAVDMLMDEIRRTLHDIYTSP